MRESVAENVHAVPIGEKSTSSTPGDVLVAYGLGSCVAICLYDPLLHIAGLLHALLPQPATEHRGHDHPTKFVDLGTALLLEEMLSLGVNRRRLQVYICGGARMIPNPDFDDFLNIGARNIQAARSILQTQRLPIRAEAVGGTMGRTVRLFVSTGKVTVKTLRDGEWILSK